MEYNIVIEGGGNSLVIDWGNDKNWARRYRAQLDGAERISLIQKTPPTPLPVVTVALGDGRRWIVFSRVFGKIDGGQQVRLYCIGWQRTVKGVNVKSLTWVYPNGAIENADMPTFADRFLA